MTEQKNDGSEEKSSSGKKAAPKKAAVKKPEEIKPAKKPVVKAPAKKAVKKKTEEEDNLSSFIHEPEVFILRKASTIAEQEGKKRVAEE
jgi:hypothetical protein